MLLNSVKICLLEGEKENPQLRLCVGAQDDKRIVNKELLKNLYKNDVLE